MIPNEGKMEQPAIDLLARRLGILPEVLECIEAIMRNKESDVLTAIRDLVRAINVLRGEVILNPDYVSGLFSLMTGNCVGLEDFADKLKVRLEYLELFIKLSFFSRSESMIDQHITDLKQSPTLGMALKYLGLPPDVIESLVRLSFNKAKYEEIHEVVDRLELKSYIDEEFMLALIAIASGQYILPRGDVPAIPSNDHSRENVHIDLHKYLRPLCARLRVDEDVAEFTINLHQGDFYFIEDRDYLIRSMLPSETIRRLCMACCGMSALRPECEYSGGIDAGSQQGRLSFQGACDILCDVLHIDPVVPELVTFNENSYNYANRHFSKHAVLGGFRYVCRLRGRS